MGEGRKEEEIWVIFSPDIRLSCNVITFLHIWETRYLLFFFFNNFYWSTVDWQCCISFGCTAKWFSCIFFFTFFFYDRLLQGIEYISLCYIVGHCWFSILCIVCVYVHLRLLVYPSCRSLFSSVTQSCLTLYDPMDYSTPGLPVHHQIPELAQTHVHWVSDAIQSPHPLPSPSPPAFNLSQHQGLFQRVSSLYQVAKVLEFQLQHQSFRWIFSPWEAVSLFPMFIIIFAFRSSPTA